MFCTKNHLKHRKNRFQGGPKIEEGGRGAVWRRGRLTRQIDSSLTKSSRVKPE